MGCGAEMTWYISGSMHNTTSLNQVNPLHCAEVVFAIFHYAYIGQTRFRRVKKRRGRNKHQKQQISLKSKASMELDDMPECSSLLSSLKVYRGIIFTTYSAQCRGHTTTHILMGV